MESMYIYYASPRLLKQWQLEEEKLEASEKALAAQNLNTQCVCQKEGKQPKGNINEAGPDL